MREPDPTHLKLKHTTTRYANLTVIFFLELLYTSNSYYFMTVHHVRIRPAHRWRAPYC
jgi:hypothetical protein